MASTSEAHSTRMASTLARLTWMASNTADLARTALKRQSWRFGWHGAEYFDFCSDDWNGMNYGSLGSDGMNYGSLGSEGIDNNPDGADDIDYNSDVANWHRLWLSWLGWHRLQLWGLGLRRLGWPWLRLWWLGWHRLCGSDDADAASNYCLDGIDEAQLTWMALIKASKDSKLK